MFATKLHFPKILEWFQNSHYEYLMLFLPSSDTKDRELDDFIIRNQTSIDRLTGEEIAYIAYEEGLPRPFVHVKEYRLFPEAIRTHVYISNEVCKYYSIRQYKLPALILISNKDLKYNLYSISTTTELDSYFTPISIVTSFLEDYHHIDGEKRKYKSLESDKTWLIQNQDRLKEEILLLEESIRENERDESLGSRIDTNYRLIFNYLKEKK